jgi:hypothetical protein
MIRWPDILHSDNNGGGESLKLAASALHIQANAKALHCRVPRFSPSYKRAAPFFLDLASSTCYSY